MDRLSAVLNGPRIGCLLEVIEIGGGRRRADGRGLVDPTEPKLTLAANRSAEEGVMHVAFLQQGLQIVVGDQGRAQLVTQLKSGSGEEDQGEGVRFLPRGRRGWRAGEAA